MPNGQFPAIFAGQPLTAALLQAFAPTTAYKAVDTSRPTFTTLTADPDLVISTAANAVYMFDAYLNFEGGTAGGSDLLIEMTSNGTLRYQMSHADLAGNNGIAATATYQGGASVGLTTNGAGVLRGASIRGSLLAGGTAGSLTLLWAQNTSSATATILHAGSWLSIRRLA